MKVNFVKCKEKDCRALMQAPWMVDGWLLVLDSMMEQYKDREKRPFVASHTATAFPIPCDCGYIITGKEERLGVCLVGHGSGMACIHCPKCSTYIEDTVHWHKTEWTEEDLILEDYNPPWEENETKEFNIKDFKVIGELKDLK